MTEPYADVPLPPQNTEAEEAVLGAMLIDPRAIPRVTPILAPDDFYRQKHGWVFRAILALRQRHDPVDYVTICDELERRDRLEAIGGSAFITRLINAVPSALHAKAYARRVHEAAVRRRVLRAASQAAQLAHREELPLDQVLDQLEQTFLQLRGQVAFEERLRPMSAVMEEAYAVLEQAHAGETSLGIASGYPDLDRLLGGFRPGNLIIVGARPSMGKSALLAAFAAQAVHTGAPSVLFSLEMSSQEIAYRLLTMDTGVDVLRLTSGRLRDDEWPPIARHAGELAERPLWIDDTPQIGVGDLRAKARRLYAEHDLAFLLVDYLQLVRPLHSHEARYREIGEITRTLKGLAKELDIPVIAASQLSRAVEHRADQRPRLADLRESGDQEQDADVVLFIHREAREEKKKYQPAELIVAKNRHGQTGSIPVFWQADRIRFVSISRQDGPQTAEPLALERNEV